MSCFFRSTETANSQSRCSVLLQEATVFSQKLRRMDRGLRALEAEAEAALESTKEILSSPLPRHVAEEAGTGVSPEVVGGPGFNGEQVVLFKAELAARTRVDIFEPLAVWTASYNSVVGQQRAVEKMEMERDVQARKVKKLRAAVDKLRLKQGRSASPKVARKLEEAMQRLQVQEGQLAVSAARYEEEEDQHYARLVLLNSDAKFLRHYVKKALQQVADALQQASTCIEGLELATETAQEAAPTAGTTVSTGLARTTPTLSPLRLNTLKAGGASEAASSGAATPREGGTPRASAASSTHGGGTPRAFVVLPAKAVSFAHANPLPTAEAVATEVVVEREGAEASPYAEILDRLAEGVDLPTTPGRA